MQVVQQITIRHRLQTAGKGTVRRVRCIMRSNLSLAITLQRRTTARCCQPRKGLERPSSEASDLCRQRRASELRRKRSSRGARRRLARTLRRAASMRSKSWNRKSFRRITRGRQSCKESAHSSLTLITSLTSRFSLLTRCLRILMTSKI